MRQFFNSFKLTKFVESAKIVDKQKIQNLFNKKISNSFISKLTKDLFVREKTNLLALDIGPSSIKAIELSKKAGEIFLEKFMIVPLPEGCINGNHIESYSMLTDALKNIVNSHGYSQRDAAIVLSGPQVVTQLLKIPAGLQDHQLATHVELEAEKYLPFSTEEVSLDFDVLDIGKKQQGHIEVLLAATKKAYVDEYINIIKASDLNIKVMDVYSCVIGRLSINTVPKQLNENVTDKVIAMIDIGHDILTVSIFKNEKQLYLKEQNFGGKLLNELIQKEHLVDYKLAENLKLKHADPAIAKIIDNFNNQLAMQIYHMLQFFYASVTSEKIDYAFVFGGCAKLPNLVTEIENKMEISVKILDPFAGINTSAYKEDNNFIENDTTLALACGLALRSYVE